jgi:hypothetical protein
MDREAAVRAKEFLVRLERELHQALQTDNWDGWKAIQDVHLTHGMKVSMTESQRVRLHELTHGFTLLADPDGTWTDQLSDRLEREYRESLVRAG